MKSRHACLIGLLLALGACGPNAPKLDEATPATGEALDEYSRNISRSVDIAKDPTLVQRFCQNTTGEACPQDITDRLKAFGYESGGTGVDLANAFALMAADKKDGTADKQSSEEDYLAAAYRVALAREPDADGAAANLTFLKEGNDRKLMLRSLLESQEFKNLK